MSIELLPFYRTLHLGSFGFDVWGAKRAVYRYLNNSAKWKNFLAQSTISKKTFGPYFRRDLIEAQHRLTAGVDGIFDKETLLALEYADAFDYIAREIWRQSKPLQPTLIEPKQGFNSLDRELWEDFSTAVHMGLTDLGTYNPSAYNISINSDHAYWPSYAFDVGISPQSGWSNSVGHAFFEKMIGRPEIEYLILGDKIWTRDRGLHAWTGGGHDNHVHTSGIHHAGGGKIL